MTQHDVARAAMVHNTTVSLALRNSPAIPEGTRLRIQEIAEELGYDPKPKLRALVANRNERRPRNRQQAIAYITNWETKLGWKEVPSEEQFHAGTLKRAAQLGFQVEHFWLGEPGMNPSRVSRVLFHRGISGAIIAGHPAGSDGLIHLDWERLSAIQIGCFPKSPALHRVVEDRVGTVRLAIQHVIAAGYENVGLVLPTWLDAQVDHAWSTGFLMEQSRLTTGRRVPFLRLHPPEDETGAFNAPTAQSAHLAQLREWFELYRPEVVLAPASSVGAQFELLGLSIPRDVAFVNLALDESDAGCAGLRQNCERVGEIATEMLVACMHQNIRGVPDVPKATMVESTWIEGASLPNQRIRSHDPAHARPVQDSRPRPVDETANDESLELRELAC